MALRMTGMMSGLDTESIIQELVSAKKTKVDSKKKEQTKLEWKQDAWKELNTKLKSLQSKHLASMRFASSYSKKTTKVSNSSAVSVITGENAVNGVQSLKIEQLAKTGYLTGAKIEGKDGGELTALSKISDITDEVGQGTINIKAGSKSVDIAITADTTISDILTKVKEAGLNASFDAKQQRFFISSKESGAANDFSITASDSEGSKALLALGLQTDVSKDQATLAEYREYAGYYVAGDKVTTLANMQSLIDKDVASRTNSYLEQYKSLKDSVANAQKKIDELTAKNLKSVQEYEADIAANAEEIDQLKKDMESVTDPDQKKAMEEQLAELSKKAEQLKSAKADAQELKTQQDNLSKYNTEIADVEQYVSVTENADGTYTAEATDKLKSEVADRYYNKAEYAASVYDAASDTVKLASSGATKVSGQDAIIYLNDAKFTNTNNTFEINGLTFTALNETKEGEAITVTTEQDTDGIYDMVKNFLKDYNALVNEMDKLYNADSAKGYEPLTSEEKEALSESEIEDYEKKIKDALLRRDDNLSTVNSALQTVMASGIEINGKTMYLYDFGIDTLGYFSAADNEKHAYHIDGDPDDESTSGNADKLKSMIANDPDTVISFFSKLSQDLYGKMSDLSKSVNGYRTYGNFYDDKKMKSDYDDYTSKIKELEEKLNDYEDKWYSKFSKMETALAKMQSNSSAVTSLLGG